TALGVKLLGDAADALSDVQESLVAIGPGSDWPSTCRQGLQVFKGDTLPIGWMHHNGNHAGSSFMMSLHGSCGLEAVAVVRGDEVGADEQQDDVSLVEV